MDGGSSGIGRDSTALGRLFGGADIPPAATGVLAVDLAALVRNYKKLRMIAAPAECSAVVKANGYGLGAAPVGAALYEAGCRTFFVATLAEAEALRAALPDPVIYVLDGLLPGTAASYAGLDLRPVLGSMVEIEEWAACCRATQAPPPPAAIHVDTGFNRLGLKAEDRRALLSAPDMLRAFPISLLMSHPASADTPSDAMNAEQLERLIAFAAELPGTPLSLANSAGIFIGPQFCLDLVRPGIALYGGNPFSDRENPMEPVVRVYGRILQTGEAEAGETVGYNGMLRLTRRTRYATVGVGYADGIFRALSSSDAQAGAPAYVDGEPLPILGRVSMDLSVFDVTGIAPGRIERGGFAELIGHHFTVDDAAALAGTIGYEILTSLGPRYHRIYFSGGTGDDTGEPSA
ncbi:MULTISPECIES: alanine racemase [Rhodomicrobium]|uniref:alanine racemase n=1 Tax=Rhodomicrobium TaxID=1068 RepID=UPI000B4BFD6F|nr:MULTISPECIES: alanine racemase [Rhodomicrobium]